MDKEEVIRKILDVELMLDGLDEDLKQLSIGIQEAKLSFSQLKDQLKEDYQITSRDIELKECQDDMKFLMRLYDNLDHLMDTNQVQAQSGAYKNKKEEIAQQIETLRKRIHELQNMS